ncbi:MAG TPA: M55 family metallopeptidase [Fimbriimonadaceae bacterium]|nr:M55 family metallopeptidase [Fimbriimonadaceae bacterium]
MKVYISADIEGISGLVSWSQCGRPNSEHYDFGWARERMTQDVNAAIRGARAAGATEVVVKDSHGNSKNLLVDRLEPGTRLISGHGSDANLGMMVGIDSTFDAAMLIGYHAMAGTARGVMEHTISGGVHRMTINGMPAGEIAMSAGVAGVMGVPIVAISSDLAGCAEASTLIPFVETAIVKTGLGRYMADCLHPSETAPLIEGAAQRGVQRLGSISPWKPGEPTTIRIEFNRSEEADFAARMVDVVRVDAYTIELNQPNYLRAHQQAWSVLSMGGLGASSHD